MIHSIKFKIFAVIVVVFILLMSLLSVGIGVVVESRMRKQAIGNATLEIQFATSQLDEQFKYMEQALYGIVLNKKLMAQLQDPVDYEEYQKILFDMEDTVFDSNYNLYSIYLLDEVNGYYLTTEHLEIVRDRGRWIEDFDFEKYARPVIIYTQSYESNMAPLISLVGPIRKDYFGETVGWVSVNTLRYSFQKILYDDDKLYPNSIQIIADGNGKLVVSQGGADSQMLQDSLPQFASGATVELNGEDYLVMQGTTKQQGWTYTKLLPEREIFAEAYQIRTMLFLSMIAFSAIMLIFIYIMLGYVTTPIYELSEKIRRYRQNDASSRVEFKTTRKDEFSYLFQSLDEMTGRIDHLIDEVYRSKLYKREMQLRMYRNGINPHFIYNILDSILWTMKFGEYAKAQQILHEFSVFLHHTLHKSREFVSVSETAEELLSYCKLEAFLADDKITVSMDISPDLGTLMMPSFLLQPLVENCFKHAFKGCKQGEIAISGGTDGGEILFCVADNGRGMDKAELASLLCHIQEYDISRDKEHFGLASVHQRLNLYYGEQYGVQITSMPGEGTVLQVRLPRERLSIA